MLNFAVGPVMMNEKVRRIGYEQIPYFRTPEFSHKMKENEALLKEFFHAPEKSRITFITGSGTASMEATVINTLTSNDKVLVVDGGSFGHRFCEICKIHDINYAPIICEKGKTLTKEQLKEYDGKDYTAFLVNLGETSTGVLYDIDLISSFCKRNNLFLIVDAISSFLCDPLDMAKHGVNVAITGSQKALALAPAISVICLDEVALERIEKAESHSLYFNLKYYLKDGERGQTPFTPAVSVLLQMHARLNQIKSAGGAEKEIEKTRTLAEYFRANIKGLPFEVFADKPSNAVTSLVLTDKPNAAYKVFEILKDEYGIFVCPNGGELKDKVFRVGHMGDLSFSDYDKLIAAFKDLKQRDII